MITFLIFYILIYGSVHTYFFFKAKPLLPNITAGIFLILFLVIMVLGPIIVRLWENINWITPARILAWITFSWMGLLFLFFSASLLLDLTRLLLFVVQRTSISSQLQLWLPLAIAVCVTTYGLFEAQSIKIEHLTIRSNKLPVQSKSFRIAQISDMHAGLLIGKSYIKKVANLIAKENPDLLISTGDLVDASMCHLDNMMAPLRNLTPPSGKYAITGNHEFYAGLSESIQCAQGAGFQMLRNQSLDVNDWLTLVGVDDDEAVRFRLVDKIDEQRLLNEVGNNRFIVFLRHRPNVNPGIIGRFDLMLSGHTHKGQIFPFSLLTAPWFTQLAGRKDLGKGSILYVSRGTGSWGPPIRFLAPPEITIIDLLPE